MSKFLVNVHSSKTRSVFLIKEFDTTLEKMWKICYAIRKEYSNVAFIEFKNMKTKTVYTFKQCYNGTFKAKVDNGKVYIYKGSKWNYIGTEAEVREMFRD